MDRITAILRCHWRAYWRGFSRSGSLNAGNQGILLIISLLALFKYVNVLRTAKNQLANGTVATFEAVLFGIFLAWLFPLMSNSRLSVTSRALKHLPLTTSELLFVRSASLFIAPFSWLIFGGSFAIVYPILFASNPISGIIAALLFIVFAWLCGMTIAQLLSVRLWRRLVFAALVFLLVFGLYLVQERGWRYSKAFTFIPATLVSGAAFGDRVLLRLLLLIVLVAIAAGTALWSFQLSLDYVDSAPAKKRTYFFLFRGKSGPLIAKDFRYFHRIFDPYLGLLASALGCFYLVVAPVPTAEIFWIFIAVVVLPNAPLTFNTFGLDKEQGLNRYALFPLTGVEIVWSKNLAYVATLLFELLLMFALALLRLGMGVTLRGGAVLLLLMLGYLSWGNLVAVNHRFKMQFYRFSSGGSPVEALVGVMVGTLPSVIAIQLFQSGKWWVSLLILLLFGATYAASLSWAAGQWRRRTESWVN